VGKTTLTGHLEVEAERQGVGPVAMIDTDSQANLSGWFGVREAETPVLVRLLPGGLRATLEALKEAGITPMPDRHTASDHRKHFRDRRRG
jgi:chromosome partitioning protein